MTAIRAVLRAGAPALAVAGLSLAVPAAALPETGVAAPWTAESRLPAGEIAGSPAPPPPPAAPVGDGLERAWFSPAATLSERVSRARRASLATGVWNFDSAARAVMSGGDPGDPVERAAAAVRLAPDLPASRMELARALWLHGDQPVSALRTALGALLAIPQHLEASIWFGGWILSVLSVSLVAGGLLCIAAAAALAAPHAAHDLGDLVSREMPRFARAAFLASALLAPLALGEGLLGLALALLLLGVVYGRAAQRLALALAAAGLLCGAFPMGQLAGSALAAFSSDPVLEAAVSTAQGISHRADGPLLEARAAEDPLAARTLALRARRAGDLAEADARYQALLREHPDDPAIANNAANVRLELGHVESALELYHRSLDLHESPVVLFNISQAYGRSFQVDDLSQTLAWAQQLDGDLVAELTGLQGAEPRGFVADLPLSGRLLWRRVLASPSGGEIADELRAGLAPGRLGRDGRTAAVAFGLTVMVGSLFGTRLRASRWCPRCGSRLCPRCDPEHADGELCDGCAQLFFRPESTDRALRLARVTALRRREKRLARAAWVASLLLPGAAGLLARRPLRSLLGAIFFSVALVAAVWSNGVVPDPLVAGAAAPFASLCLVILAVLGYAVAVATSLAARRRA